ncbi:hypothetical protein IWQ60_001683 [Tieghemiomyces parasiticus]|uniref:Uncharacterized protein n=1 Tax=Tieghemiomyces parasiticus TaxID=78921 RepID=A0A9W8DY28_9FUNG|nr:hypothetical protein IWQ60_001683 [Tieghemiomyces parasiticus]
MRAALYFTVVLTAAPWLAEITARPASDASLNNLGTASNLNTVDFDAFMLFSDDGGSPLSEMEETSPNDNQGLSLDDFELPTDKEAGTISPNTIGVPVDVTTSPPPFVLENLVNALSSLNEPAMISPVQLNVPTIPSAPAPVLHLPPVSASKPAILRPIAPAPALVPVPVPAVQQTPLGAPSYQSNAQQTTNDVRFTPSGSATPSGFFEARPGFETVPVTPATASSAQPSVSHQQTIRGLLTNLGLVESGFTTYPDVESLLRPSNLDSFQQYMGLYEQEVERDTRHLNLAQENKIILLQSRFALRYQRVNAAIRGKFVMYYGFLDEQADQQKQVHYRIAYHPRLPFMVNEDLITKYFDLRRMAIEKILPDTAATFAKLVTMFGIMQLSQGFNLDPNYMLVGIRPISLPGAALPS